MKIYKKEMLEPIMSMSKIGGSDPSDKFKYCIYVNPDLRRSGNPYFKFYNADSFRKATKVIRLGIKKFELIIHNDGFETWNITKKDAKYLDDFLSSPSRRNRKINNWKYTCFKWNDEYDFIGKYPEDYADDIEAYLAGYYDTEENCNHPCYIPSWQEQIIYSDYF